MKIAIILSLVLWAAVSLYAQKREEPLKEPQLTESVFAAESLSSDRLAKLIAQADSNTYLIDVRTAEEFKSGAIPTAINIPYDVIENNLPTQDRSARIVVYCRTGHRASIAKAKLEALGFTQVNNFGGIDNWDGELVKH
jgi:rhodanese-related sulfurtransferase